MLYPRPEVAATSSARISQVQAQPRLIRIESQIPGATREHDADRDLESPEPTVRPSLDEVAAGHA